MPHLTASEANFWEFRFSSCSSRGCSSQQAHGPLPFFCIGLFAVVQRLTVSAANRPPALNPKRNEN